jgi:CRISPR/Cas system-associated exonuclease Cas4 (RecB family)
MDLDNLRREVGIVLEKYITEWIKTHKESNILDYIEHNKKIKIELNREYNKYANKEIIKQINKKIKNDIVPIYRDKDEVKDITDDKNK